MSGAALPRLVRVPPSDEGLSRRGLFRFGLDRVRQPEPPPPPPRNATSPDPEGQVARWHAAREGSDGGRLGAQAVDLLLEAVSPGLGDRVLDAGAGEGHLAATAVERGATVTALERAAAPRARGVERVPAAEWFEGEPELLPFADASFDHALSAFSLTASLNAPAALAELFRVVRPGGTVALSTWRPGGVVGKLLRLADAVDPLPDGLYPPLSWGREDRVRSEMRERAAGASYDHETLRLAYASREEAVDALCAGLVPLAAALAALPGGDGAGLRAEVARLVGEHADEGEDGRLTLEARVLVVAADRP